MGTLAVQALAGQPRRPVKGFMAVVTIGGEASAEAATCMSCHRTKDAADRFAAKLRKLEPSARAEWADVFTAAGGTVVTARELRAQREEREAIEASHAMPGGAS